VLCRDGTAPYHGAGNDSMDGVGDADPVAACDEAVRELRVGGPRVQVPDVRAGRVTVPGPGRALGSSLDLHESMGDATVVALCEALLTAVKKEFAEDRYRTGSVEKLETLQAGIGLSLSAVKNSVWTLERSGIVGLLLRYKAASIYARDGSHNMVVVEATWSTEVGLVLACSEVEACLDAAGGCRFAPAVLDAFEKVRAAVNVPMQTVLELLVTIGNPFAKIEGRCVLYGQSLCVVRRGLPSWPLVVLHKSRKGLSICLTCPNSHLSCVHYTSAQSAAADQERDDNGEDVEAGDFTGLQTESDSDGEEEQRKQVGKGASAAELKKRRFITAQSMLPRALVPPMRAQAERRRLMDAARDTNITLDYEAPQVCPFCLVGPPKLETPSFTLSRVEFGDGAIVARSWYWQCGKCMYNGTADGRTHGVVFLSQFSAYSECFLFETAVNMARNGPSVSSLGYLRAAFHELSVSSLYPQSRVRLRHVSTLRKAIMLYIRLVIAGLPLAL